MRVFIVFDRAYGTRENADLGDAFWLIESPHNRALAEQAWRSAIADPNSAVFQASPDLSLQDEAMCRFDDADLHHPTWTEITFSGVLLTEQLEHQFLSRRLKVAPNSSGFVVHR